MSLTRGILAAILWAFIGAASVVVMVGVVTAVLWFVNDVSSIDRRDDIRWWCTYGGWPVIGVAIYFGFAALAVYTPKHRVGFARTFAIISAASVLLTAAVSMLDLTPRRIKGVEQPDLYWSEFLLFFVPPLLTAFLLIVHRAWVGDETAKPIAGTQS